MFELDVYEEERNHILLVGKLKMHGNQKASYGAERQVDG